MLFFGAVMWQLPQFLLGSLLLLILRKHIILRKDYKDTNVYILDGKFTGASLGGLIFVNKAHKDRDRIIKHEYGHFKQGITFGWLYLIIIGIPSGGMNLLTRWKILKIENYYKRWPENWADKLGKV